MRKGVSFNAMDILSVLDGAAGLQPTTTSAGDVAKWKRTNAQLFSTLFFGTEGSAHVAAKPFKGSFTAGPQRDGAGAWQALAARFGGNTK